MFNVVIAKTPMEVDLVESHKSIKTVEEAVKVLKQWKEEDDTFFLQETCEVKPGMFVTPILILDEYGDPMDIFGQLITKEAP